MSDTETEKFRQIGIDLINEYRQQRGLMPIQYMEINTPEVSAFIRSIQLHEKTKQELADFKQEVSDAVMQAFPNTGLMPDCLGKIIIPAPKPDPLAQTLGDFDGTLWEPEDVLRFRAALEARGLEIREKNDGL